MKRLCQGEAAGKFRGKQYGSQPLRQHRAHARWLARSMVHLVRLLPRTRSYRLLQRQLRLDRVTSCPWLSLLVTEGVRV